MSALYNVYRNLNTGNFSLRLRGKVLETRDIYLLHDVVMRVSQPGRKRVIRDKRKNVHAYLGAVSVEKLSREKAETLRETGEYIHYDPYITEYFMHNNESVFSAKKVLCIDNKAYILKN